MAENKINVAGEKIEKIYALRDANYSASEIAEALNVPETFVRSLFAKDDELNRMVAKVQLMLNDGFTVDEIVSEIRASVNDFDTCLRLIEKVERNRKNLG